MAMVTDDFSFPKLTTTNNDNNTTSVSQFSLSSPSIWRISSLVYPDNGDEEHEDVDGDDSREITRKHKSFSEYESGESEARMDLLWQDFNERELQRASSLDCRIKTRQLSGGAVSNRPEEASGRPGRLARRPRRTSTVVLLRALRKLFFIHSLIREKKSL